MMTSFPTSDGLLLSPLCEDLLNLTRERECKLESEYKVASKNSAMSIKILNNDVRGGKKTKAVDDNWRDNREYLDGCEQKILHGDILECHTQAIHDFRCKSLPDKFKNLDNNTLNNKRRESMNGENRQAVSGHSLQDVSFEHTSFQSHGNCENLESRCTSPEKIEEHMATTSQKDVSVDHGKSRGKGSYPTCKAYSEGEMVEKAIDDSTLKTGPPVVSLAVEGGKNSKVRQSSGKKALKSDSFRDGDRAVPKKKSSGRKDANLDRKDAVQTSLDPTRNPTHLSDRAFANSPMNFNLDDVKAKAAPADKLKERLSDKKYIDVAPSDSRMAEPPAAAVPFKEGTFGGLEQTVVNPMVINEEWVCCDCCETWRLLPHGIDPEQLPEKWVCSLLDWL